MGRYLWILKTSFLGVVLWSASYIELWDKQWLIIKSENYALPITESSVPQLSTTSKCHLRIICGGPITHPAVLLTVGILEIALYICIYQNQMKSTPRQASLQFKTLPLQMSICSSEVTVVRRKPELFVPRGRFFAQHCAKMKDDHKTWGKKKKWDMRRNKGRRIKKRAHHFLSFSFLWPQFSPMSPKWRQGKEVKKETLQSTQ
jgi:hypothetical protein